MVRRQLNASKLLRALALAGSLGAIWLAATEVLDASPLAATGAKDEAVTAGSTVPQFNAVNLASFSETLTRPLFNATRKPLSVANDTTQLDAVAPLPADAQAKANDLRLIGIMTSEATGWRALIAPGGEADARWVQTGTDIGGWRLAEIDKDHVVVELAGIRTVLKLYPARITAVAE